MSIMNDDHTLISVTRKQALALAVLKSNHESGHGFGLDFWLDWVLACDKKFFGSPSPVPTMDHSECAKEELAV
jgi:hypothetical protein